MSQTKTTSSQLLNLPTEIVLQILEHVFYFNPTQSQRVKSEESAPRGHDSYEQKRMRNNFLTLRQTSKILKSIIENEYTTLHYGLRKSILQLDLFIKKPAGFRFLQSENCCFKLEEVDFQIPSLSARDNSEQCRDHFSNFTRHAVKSFKKISVLCMSRLEYTDETESDKEWKVFAVHGKEHERITRQNLSHNSFWNDCLDHFVPLAPFMTHLIDLCFWCIDAKHYEAFETDEWKTMLKRLEFFKICPNKNSYAKAHLQNGYDPATGQYTMQYGNSPDRILRRLRDVEGNVLPDDLVDRTPSATAMAANADEIVRAFAVQMADWPEFMNNMQCLIIYAQGYYQDHRFQSTFHNINNQNMPRLRKLLISGHLLDKRSIIAISSMTQIRELMIQMCGLVSKFSAKPDQETTIWSDVISRFSAMPKLISIAMPTVEDDTGVAFADAGGFEELLEIIRVRLEKMQITRGIETKNQQLECDGLPPLVEGSREYENERERIVKAARKWWEGAKRVDIRQEKIGMDEDNIVASVTQLQH